MRREMVLRSEKELMFRLSQDCEYRYSENGYVLRTKEIRLQEEIVCTM